MTINQNEETWMKNDVILRPDRTRFHSPRRENFQRSVCNRDWKLLVYLWRPSCVCYFRLWSVLSPISPGEPGPVTCPCNGRPCNAFLFWACLYLPPFRSAVFFRFYTESIACTRSSLAFAFRACFCLVKSKRRAVVRILPLSHRQSRCRHSQVS